MNQLIGIVDEPNPKGANDELDIKLHAAALTEFIKGCPTPLTIGVQGEWGSGKTSILNSIYHDLSNEGSYKQIWINSWESSLLSTPEEALLKIINEIIDEMMDADIDKSRQDKIKQTASAIFKGALRVGTSMVNSKVGEITEELLQTKGNSIKQLRESLNALANEVMERDTNPYKKIVVYVDDLDRIEPKEAVKILELLKNIFSIHGCVFILAIDYQVVVKGLEDKFGKRTEDNEWEFRAFFDKIIQLPFMMPLGQYNIGKYVSTLFKQIGFIETNEINEEVIETVISNSIGGNPRALKRLVNSLSLITIFLKIQSQNLDILTNKNKKALLFSMVCIQIAFPSIYELLVSSPDFSSWNDELAYSVTKLKEEENLEKFNKEFESAKETADFDEGWEQALFRICYITPRYYKRATDISRLLSYIKDDMLKNEKEDLDDIIAEVINETSVTSVSSTDDFTVGKKKFQKVRYDTLDAYIENVLKKNNFQHNIIDLVPYIVNDLTNEIKETFFIQYAPGSFTLNIDSGKRNKVFCYINLRKKFLLIEPVYMNVSDVEELFGLDYEEFKRECSMKKIDSWTGMSFKENISSIETYNKYFRKIILRAKDNFIKEVL
ncbi:MAG: hypothetical protein FK731_03705 [Asgard group archaeon]|nr:hypothetical protein [Asgard group archaeon]